MDPETVKALRDCKGLFDEGVLTEDEYKSKKAELLRPKAAAPPAAAAAAAPAAPAAKKKRKEAAAAEGAGEEKKAKKAAKAAELVLQDGGASGVLVTGGGTFRAKGLLSSLGGTWSKQLKAWVFGAGTADKVTAALRASQSPAVELSVAAQADDAAGARERELKRAKDDAIAAAATTAANAKLSVEPHKKAIVVRGDTKAVLDMLKALGGSWNRALGGWVFQRSRQDEVLKALRADASNTVSLDGKLAAPKAAAPAASDDDARSPKAGPAASPEDVVAAACASIPATQDAEPKDLTPASTYSETKTKASREIPAWPTASQASAEPRARAPEPQTAPKRAHGDYDEAEFM